MFIEIFGSKNIFLNKVKKSSISYSENYLSYSNYEFLQELPDIFLFATMHEHKFQLNSNEDKKDLVQNEFMLYSGNTVVYQLQGDFYNQHYQEGEMWFRVNIFKKNEIRISSGDYFKILVDAISNVIDKGILD